MRTGGFIDHDTCGISFRFHRGTVVIEAATAKTIRRAWQWRLTDPEEEHARADPGRQENSKAFFRFVRRIEFAEVVLFGSVRPRLAEAADCVLIFGSVLTGPGACAFRVLHRHVFVRLAADRNNHTLKLTREMGRRS